MAKAPIPVGYLKVAATGLFGPAQWVNVFYFEVVAPADTDAHTVADAAQAVDRLYQSVIEEVNLSSDWNVAYCTVSYRNSSSTMYRARIADASVGSGGGSSQAAQVAYLINWFTGDPRRGGKARQYICGVPDAALADSAALNAGLATAMSGRIATWLAGIQSSTLTNGTKLIPVEMSFVNGKADRSVPLAYAIGGGSINPIVATQRRRVDRLRPA